MPSEIIKIQNCNNITTGEIVVYRNKLIFFSVAMVLVNRQLLGLSTLYHKGMLFLNLYPLE